MNTRRFLCWFMGMVAFCAMSHAQHWTFDSRGYQYDMTVFPTLQIDGVAIPVTAGYEIAAFCGTECRGVAEVVTDEANGETVSYYYLRVRSNSASGEKITFKCYSPSEDKEYDLATTIDFVSLAQMGYPSNPLVLECTLGITFYNISVATSDASKGTVSATGVGEKVLPNTTVTVTAIPVEGYSFSNWTVGEVEKSTDNPYEFTASEDIALIANFVPNKYDVTFDVDGQRTTSSLDFGSVITKPADPTKEGYTFTGWFPAFVEGATVPVDGITYTAQFSVNTYNLTYIVDGEIYKVVSIAYGTPITPEAAPEKDGYVFSGWSEIPEVMPAEDVTVTGTFSINTSIKSISATALVDVYTLNGVRVVHQVAVSQLGNKLASGVYLINGKKFYVK